MAVSDAEYVDCIVTFFDILGFRSLITTKPKSEIADVLVLFRHVSTKRDGLDQVNLPSDWPRTHVEIVSDAIVRTTTNGIEPVSGVPTLYDELLALKEVQLECIQRGVFLRGAMTIGKMHVGPDWTGPIFGPALVEAFEMESQEVLYPRIGVHEDVVDHYKNHPDPRLRAYHDGSREMLDLLLSQDGAGLYYLNYLRVTMSDRNNSPDEVLKTFQKHKAMILAGLNLTSQKVRRKYTWLKNYHNSAVHHGIAEDIFDPYRDISATELFDPWQALVIDA